MRKPDPELLPIDRRRCPRCQTRMITVGIESELGGFERRSFECRGCGHAEIGTVAGDPYSSDAAIRDLRVSE